MRLTRILLRLTPAAIIALAGCGQTGALYLPDAGVETPVEIRAPATPAPEPASAPAPAPDDKKKKTDQPQGR
jgi:predicted small lipoprotein YifL